MLENKKMILHKVARILKTKPKEADIRAENLINEIKALEKEIESLKAKLVGNTIDEILSDVQEISSIPVIAYELAGVDMNSLRTLGDQLKVKLGSGLIILASEMNGKAQFVAMATDDVVAKGIHAGNIIKHMAQITGGGGGGRPNMAQAGGKDPKKIKEALNAVKELVSKQVS